VLAAKSTGDANRERFAQSALRNESEKFQQQQYARAPELRTSASSTSLHAQHASRASELHTSMRPTRPYARSTPTAHLQSSMPLCVLHVSTSTPASHLRNSIPLCVLHVPTPAARLHRISGSPYLYASYTSLYPQHACIASPEIHTSTRPTRPYTRSTPAAHLQTS